eukprot:3621394-Rhodomonas_salina.1
MKPPEALSGANVRVRSQRNRQRHCGWSMTSRSLRHGLSARGVPWTTCHSLMAQDDTHVGSHDKEPHFQVTVRLFQTGTVSPVFGLGVCEQARAAALSGSDLTRALSPTALRLPMA